MRFDPVGGLEVDDTTEFTSEYDGETYYFCSNACKEEFESDPEQYIAAAWAAISWRVCEFAGVITRSILQ